MSDADGDATDRVTVERPELERTNITEEVESVQIFIISDDRTRTFDSEDIVRVDEAYDNGEFVATEAIFNSDPDLMRGLSGATIHYSDGETASGSAPWAQTGDNQIMLVITAGGPYVESDTVNTNE